MAQLDLKIAEAKLDEFEAWFRTNMPDTAVAEVMSFDRVLGVDDVTYNVRIKPGTAAGAALTRATWSEGLAVL